MLSKIDRCNICGGKVEVQYKLKNKDLIGMAEDYTQEVAICPHCGFIFTRNPFTVEQLNNRYKNFSKFEYDDESYILDESQGYKIGSQEQKHFIERNIHLNDVHSVLEIGAASGYNLSLYTSQASVYGVEPSKINCKNAMDRYGVPMFCGVFDEFEESVRNTDKRWDMIFMSHTLEHIVNPCDFVRKCEKMNTRYFFIEVPTFDYKLSNEPFGMFCEEHVNMFTLESLQNLMNECGYPLVSADFNINVTSKLPAGSPAMKTIWEKPFKKKYQFINNSKNILCEYINDSENLLAEVRKRIAEIDEKKKLAIWGTGHHVSMLLANTDLLDKNIVKVYDSDRRKYGQKLNGCEIGAFSENDIIQGNVQAILLATYTAQDALEKILETYQNKVEVIKLY